MNYYNFIAGAPDLQIENIKSAPKMEELLQVFQSILTKGDMEFVNVLRCEYDNKYFLSLVEKRASVLSPIALYNEDEWAEMMAYLNDDDTHKKKDKRIYSYIEQFYNRINVEEGEEEPIASKEDYLSTLYYEYGMKSANKFLSAWFEFNLNVNNILAALASRKYKWDIKSVVVGENVVAQSIRTNPNVRDFNLTTEIDYFEQINAIAEVENLLDREKRIDLLKWNWLEEQLYFKPFSIEQILAYWIKCSLIHRWDNLTQEDGTEVFRSMLKELKKGISF